MVQNKIQKPKHRRIFEDIHAAIVGGQYAPGARIPSEAQLVRRFDTSRPTVARALRDLEHAGYLERRMGSGSYVRLPAEVGGKLLGLLIPELGQTEVFDPICGEIARSVQAHGLTLLWGNASADGSGSNNRQAEQLCRQYIEQKVAGVFFAPVVLKLAGGRYEVNRRIAQTLDRAGIPVVLLDRDVEKFPRRSKFDMVAVDNRRAGYVQAEHLLKLGCRRIGYVAQPLYSPAADARISGYREAMLQYGIHPQDDWVRRGELADVRFVKQLVETRLEAVICANDHLAANLMHNLGELGVRVPRDVRVVGLDNVKYAKLLSVPLTTLQQPCRDLGAAAVRAMTERMNSPSMAARDILLDCKLVVRESCGANLADES